MPRRSALVLAATVSFAGRPGPSAPPTIVPNPNTHVAGTARGAVTTIELDAVHARWHTDGGTQPITDVDAFAERGKAPTMPGPLVRVPVGTLIRFSVRNTFDRPITFFAPTSASTFDSVDVAPGATAELSVRAEHAGNYLYRATDGSAASKRLHMAGALAGAFVVDSAATARAPRDRVLMILMTPDSGIIRSMEAGATLGTAKGKIAFTINGRSWPRTERIAATVGDTVHWRVINGSWDVHPMHLHGFYFIVDRFDGPLAARDGQSAPAGPVVTERLSNFSSMSMTWVPDRAGNWLFHCHFALHLQAPGANARVPSDHSMSNMVGLVMGIEIKPRAAQAVVAQASVRRLRILAVRDTAFPDSAPSMRFVIDEHGTRRAAGPRTSPELELTKGEPVAITVVNGLAEPTAVHWHGMELESYNDGVAGWSGTATHLAPVIAPGDSFTARFTPPRAGTFMYHSHHDDFRQQPAGLAGPMIVRDGSAGPREDDHDIFINGTPAVIAKGTPLTVNGKADADTVIFRVGHPQRLRLLSLALLNPNATVWLTARPDSSLANLPDTMVVRWRPIAKDGADVPASARIPVLARQIVSMGETYDFEYTPSRPGTLRIEIRGAGPAGALLARVPVVVR